MQKCLPYRIIAEKYADLPIFDVRSPAEYQRGHIPGALNLPLFEDQDREDVGTIYKQNGKQAAILEGLDRVGPRMRGIVETVRAKSRQKTIVLHCWRGGMRSESVAWLLSLCDYEVILLEGGYKAFRQHVLAMFEQQYTFLVLGGYTGSGKTRILTEMQKQAQQVIDLEGLAHHKGSSFGALGEEPPPTQQQFENRLAIHLQKCDPEKPIWLEDESRRIGGRSIPHTLWEQLRSSPLFVLHIPAESRTVNLLEDYGHFPADQLSDAIKRLAKRLGDQSMRHALDLVKNGNFKACCLFLLEKYYDPMYAFGISKRSPEQLRKIQGEFDSFKAYADELIKTAENLSRNMEQAS